METKKIIVGDIAITSMIDKETNSSYIDSLLSKVIKVKDYTIITFEASVKSNYVNPKPNTGLNMLQFANFTCIQ